jgi:WD40 repeat protein
LVFQALVQASSGPAPKTAASANNSLVIARQLSDFHISKIMFSPYQEDGLVSCGRENIRFWRMRKGHLPGRPVQLNEFSRGYLFTDLTYVNAPELGTEESTGVLSPCVLVASSLGLLLRVDCAQEQVVCAYQLHNGPIRSLSVNGSYAVTGGDDCRMRIWPLHFTDFLMEAHHEAAVTHVFVSQDMRLLSVGTASGTLGILDVMDHRYWTVLRSHVGSVVCVATRPPLGEEFLSIGKDNTIRLWDATTGQQKFEFDSPQDTPLCGAYHPVEHVLAVGFASGAVRIFEVQTTSTRFERTHRNPSPIASVLYSQAKDFTTASQLRLYALSLSGTLSVYDVGDNYTPIRSISVPPNPWEGIIARDIKAMRYPAMMQMTISKDGRLLATSCGSVNSLCVFDTAEMVTVYKGSSLQGRAASAPAPSSDHSMMSMHQAMASSLRSHGSHAMTAASTIGLAGEGSPMLGTASTPIAGLIFCLDTDRSNIEDSNTLLIVTDKRVISMDIAVRNESLPSAPAVLESTYALNLSQDDISSRRLEGNVRPVPGSISRDHTTGLLFMAVRCDSPKGDEALVDSTTPYSKYIRPITGDALAVVGCTVKKTRDPKTYQPSARLSLTSMQILDDIPGEKSILSTSPCGPSSNRIVMADSGGGVAIYHMRDDRISRLKDKGSPHQMASLEDSLIDAEEEDAFLFDAHGISPPAPASDMYRAGGIASIQEDDVESGRRDLDVDFADHEDVAESAQRVQAMELGNDSDERRKFMSQISMNAMYDDSPDSTKQRVSTWEEQSGGPVGTPPAAASSVRWKDSEERAASHTGSGSGSGTISSSMERKVTSSSTTVTTTTSRSTTSSSQQYAKSVPMAATSKRTTTALTMAAGRSTTSSRNQKTGKKDPSAAIRRSGSSTVDDSSATLGKENTLSGVPISPVSANYSHDLNASFGSDTELVKEQMSQAHFSSHSLEEGYESDGDSVDSDVDVMAGGEVRNTGIRGTRTMECAFKGPLAPARVLSQKIKGTLRYIELHIMMIK